jgi:hypothetical protein
MMIVVRGEQKEEKFTVVSLSVDHDKWNYLKMFHCPTDRTPLFKYSGDILSISPTGVWEEMSVIVQCPTCKNQYLINRPSSGV